MTLLSLKFRQGFFARNTPQDRHRIEIVRAIFSYDRLVQHGLSLMTEIKKSGQMVGTAHLTQSLVYLLQWRFSNRVCARCHHRPAYGHHRYENRRDVLREGVQGLQLER